MDIYKYDFEDSRSPSRKTALNFRDRIKRIPTELGTFLYEGHTEINVDNEKLTLSVKNDYYNDEEIHHYVQKCLSDLDFVIISIFTGTDGFVTDFK